MSIPLPEHASEASRRRADLAQRLAQSCPPDLADEIALVGSTARGYADDDSDLELNLWADAIPPLEARLAWLDAAGASEIYPEEMPRDDQSYWIHGLIGSIKFEVGWQTFQVLHQRIDNILAAKEIDFLGFPYILINAIALRTEGQLQSWQEVLNNYSDALQRFLIDIAITEFTWPNGYIEQRKLVRRGERLKLTQYLLIDLHQAMCVLFAINRRWMPSDKWTLTVAREFAPFDLDARIDAILGDPSLEKRVDLCAQLCLDVLALVPKDYDVSKAVEALKAGL